jgi:hypothetical protein
MAKQLKTKAQVLLEKLFELSVEKVEVIPNGFKNVETWMNDFGLGRSQTERYLATGVKAGVMEMKKFRTFEKDRYYRRSYFREIV